MHGPNKEIASSDLKDGFYTYFEEAFAGPEARPPSEGESDPHLIALVNTIMHKSRDFVLVDFGCGRGPFVRTLNNLNTSYCKVLDHMHYIGVDLNSMHLSECNREAHENGFAHRVRKFEVKDPLEFFNSLIPVDYVFMNHTFHEISPLLVPIVLKYLLFCLKPGGQFVIHELKQLLKGERDFITYDEKDLKRLFDHIKGITCNIYPFKTKYKKLGLYNAYVIKKRHRFVPLWDYYLEDQYIKVLWRKRMMLYSRKKAFKEKNSRAFADLVTLLTNVSNGILEFENYQKLVIGKGARCWHCGEEIRAVVRMKAPFYYAIPSWAGAICPNCSKGFGLDAWLDYAIYDRFRDCGPADFMINMNFLNNHYSAREVEEFLFEA